MNEGIQWANTNTTPRMSNTTSSFKLADFRATEYVAINDQNCNLQKKRPHK